jgi:hypothetical protein
VRSAAIWAAVIVPVWIVCALCTYWEPIVRDSWGHVWWHHATDVSLYEFAKDTYLHNNPRIGQVITWLLITPGPWHVIVTPLVELAMFYLLTVLVLGRWPSLRSERDALTFATITAMVLATCPLVGPMLFYRPFTGNYLYGLVLDLALLVPFRLHLEAAFAPRRWLAPVMLVAAFAAGLANEHTDPALAALCGLAVIVAWRRRTLRPWMIAGLVGVLAGAAALLLAPGQNMRYEGLATQQSLLERITARGADNVDIVTALCRYLRPLLFWFALAGVAAWFARRRVPRITWVLAATALAITLTLVASPKLGARLYLASVAFSCAAAASFVLSQLEATWSRALAWALAAVFALRTGGKLVSVYANVGPTARARLTAIEAARPGTVLQLPTYSEPRSRWFMGDDFAHTKWRQYVAESFGLAAIELLDATGQRPATTPDVGDDAP